MTARQKLACIMRFRGRAHKRKNLLSKNKGEDEGWSTTYEPRTIKPVEFFKQARRDVLE